MTSWSLKTADSDDEELSEEVLPAVSAQPARVRVATMAVALMSRVLVRFIVVPWGEKSDDAVTRSRVSCGERSPRVV
jgi:hypothetical protein